MARLSAALLLVAVGAIAGGCAPCCTPYDYCGPVMDGGCCINEDLDGRVGSAFHGPPAMGPPPAAAVPQTPYYSGR